MKDIEPLTESDVRNMRDQIYGKCSDHNWNECKHNWLRQDSIEWLLEETHKESVK